MQLSAWPKNHPPASSIASWKARSSDFTSSTWPLGLIEMMCDFRRGHVTSECVSIAISCSLTDDAVFLIQSVDEGAGDQALVVDASQLGVAGTRDVHRAEGTARKEEAVGIASGISVKARNVAVVIDAEGDRAF